MKHVSFWRGIENLEKNVDLVENCDDMLYLNSDKKEGRDAILLTLRNTTAMKISILSISSIYNCMLCGRFLFEGWKWKENSAHCKVQAFSILLFVILSIRS